MAIAAGIALFTGILLGNFETILRIVISVILLIVGLNFLEIIPMPNFGAEKDRRIKNRPYLSGLIIGLVFGLVLGPCALAFMAPILGIAMSNVSTNFWFCIFLVSAFIVGHCGILILAGTFAETVKKYLSKGFASKGSLILRKICGVLIIVGAIYTLKNIVIG